MARLRPKHAFENCATDYAEYRPGYPVEVLEALEAIVGQANGRWAADVGAGTGIFSRLLADRGWHVAAIEPTESMLTHATGAGIGRVCATGEFSALADRSVALVTVAQAFHWFNPPYALAEFARILKPGGLVALLWNNRDPNLSLFEAAYQELVTRYNPSYDGEYRQQDWPAKIAEAGGFEPTEYHSFNHTWRVSAERFVGYTRSVSYIRNVLSRERRPRFEDDLRELMRDHFGDADCAHPLRTDLWTACRR